jgi:hypothetical protein
MCTKVSKDICWFSSDASDTLLVFSVKNVCQPVLAAYICGLFMSAFTTSMLVSLKKVNVHVAAAWMVVPTNHTCKLDMLNQKKKHQQLHIEKMKHTSKVHGTEQVVVEVATCVSSTHWKVNVHTCEHLPYIVNF